MIAWTAVAAHHKCTKYSAECANERCRCGGDTPSAERWETNHCLGHFHATCLCLVFPSRWCSNFCWAFHLFSATCRAVAGSAAASHLAEDVLHYRKTRSIHTFKIDLNWKMAMRRAAHLKFKSRTIVAIEKQRWPTTLLARSLHCARSRWFNHSISIYILQEHGNKSNLIRAVRRKCSCNFSPSPFAIREPINKSARSKNRSSQLSAICTRICLLRAWAWSTSDVCMEEIVWEFIVVAFADSMQRFN